MSPTDPLWLLWMAGTVALWWATPGAARPFALAGVGAAFLGVHAPASALILAALTALTWRLTRGGPRLAAGGILGVVLLFLAIKAPVVTEAQRQALGGLVPLGFSYYTLRCVHVLLESYRGTAPPPSLRELLLHLFFLPTLPSGPIHTLPPLARDLRRLRWDAPRFSRGLERILLGYVSITLLGNLLVSEGMAGRIAPLQARSPALFEYLDCLRYGLNLYFQFAGASAVAVGFALLLGFTVVENFDAPWRSRNLPDFWRRWHLSLGQWCREVVYLPVVSWTRRETLGLVAAMVVLGLWHELSPRYLAWGLYHGLGIAVWRGLQRVKPALPSPPAALVPALDVLSVLLTLHYVLFSFALTKAPTLTEGLQVWARILGGG